MTGTTDVASYLLGAVVGGLVGLAFNLWLFA